MLFRILKFVALVCALTTMLRCASVPKTPEMTPEMNANLTEEEAAFRATQISNIHYDFELKLSESNTYSGVSKISFQGLKIENDLRLDFHKGRIDSVVLNGEKLKLAYNGHFLLLPAKHLRKGENRVEVAFQHAYSNQGRGFHQFKDPEDQKVYTYSDFEPFDANHAVPCFDQPDLKATYKSTVLAPKDWLVISSTRESQVEAVSPTTKKWIFPESGIFSTYIWSLHAGPYTMWEDNSGAVPLRLFARQSVAKFVEPEEWFTVSKQGFEFFNSYFDYPYPYKKYDQVLVPEFNAGAMENVGAVTFNERYIARGAKTESEREDMANVILHEMAHMWFGNLVTMKWWNDLWLNESFATYMAALALVEATEFKGSWRDFNSTKNWAYFEDQLVTTHPIEGNVEDTLQTFANFDGITYGKGASVLKQMAYYLGKNNFREGVRAYFKKHAYSNTQLKDFMGALSSASDKNLKDWQKLWLQTSGVNTLKADIQCKDGKIESLSILQTAPESNPILRAHALEVAFLKNEKGTFGVTERLKVEIDGDKTLVEKAKGLVCPDIVYPNSNDQGYFKVALDSTSLKHLKSSISDVEDPFLRQLLWATLWDMVRDAQLKVQAYADLLLTGSLHTETDDYVLRTLLTNLHGSRRVIPSVLFYMQFQKDSSRKEYFNLVTRFEESLWKRLTNAKGGSENQKVFFNSYLNVVETQTGLNRLKKLLDGTISLNSLSIDQDRRWNILNRLALFKYPGSERMIDLETKRDHSAAGKEEAIRAQASLPEWKIKEQWINEFKKEDSTYSLRQLRTAFSNLMPAYQPQFRKQYSDRFYVDMKEADSNKPVYIAGLLTHLAPFPCGGEGKGELTQFISQNPQLKPSIKKDLLIANQESETCEKITN